ncbi:hypothetical protein [Aureispira anguillae]|uniref:Outer membrane protein beta-barrel domain-containing protein n=1 Tax=Aureispira anguillae TaxID=2864201 RepID=A0A916DQN2_9BACT|nr:hypothetical protein [Aureispira anguillae]BDS09807.1 hypothetical protein AsAng_0005120 [Aureispira anguillae]
MKTFIKLLLSLSILCCNCSLWAQKDNRPDCIKNTIIWDFSKTGSDQLDEPCCLKKGKNVKIHIININRNAYEISINKQLKSYHTTRPEILDIEKMKTDAAVASKVSGNAHQGIKDRKGVNPDPIDNLTTAIQELQKYLACATCFNDILNSNVGHQQAEKDRDACMQQNLGKSYSKADIGANMSMAFNNIKIAHGNLPPLPAGASVEDKVDLAKLETSYTALMTNSNSLKAINDITTLYEQVSNPRNYSFFTTIPLESASELVLDLEAKPKQGLNLQPEKLPLVYAIKGVKISFSPSLFFNHFPGAKTYTLKDYKLNNQATDSITIHSSFDDKSLIPSIGALVHVSFGGCSDLDFAISAGISTQVETGSMRWHLGNSFILGKKRRFVLSTGISLGQGINELDEKYETDKPYPTAVLKDQNLLKPTAHLGWFLGISYNIPIK